jgi:class 3 adenylate cyclase
VRHQISLHRGREVKTMGDGFLATFDGPARAIRCACALQDEVAGLGLEVRAGIHTGEVLVSSTVRELVVGSGLEFSERGVEKLKGAPGEWRLFAIESPPT